MSKKMISLILSFAIVLSIFVIVPVTASAYTYGTWGGFDYRVGDDGKAVITGYSGTPFSVAIPSSIEGHTVVGIGEHAFSGNENIISVSIPDTVTYIAGSRDYNYTNPAIYASSWEEFNSIFYSLERPFVTVYYNGAFSHCPNLRSVTLGKGIKTIQAGAFYDCDGLEHIKIPENVTKIEEAAFYDCDNLRRVEILGTVELSSNYLNEDLVLYVGYGSYQDYDEYYGYYTNYVEGPEKIDIFGPFESCDKLREVDFKSGCTMIGYSTFRNCPLLSEIELPDSLTSIGEYAFQGCKSLSSVTIPDSVTSIGRYAFSNCEWLSSLTISDSVTSISDSAFQGCTVLKNVIIPDSVTDIGSSAFQGCKRLKNVTIPDSVKRIGYMAFHGCVNLITVTIPKSVEYIGSMALGYYYNFTGAYTSSTQRQDFVIYGYKGTAAESYASNNYLIFRKLDIDPEQKTGDADGDGKIDLTDVTYIQWNVLLYPRRNKDMYNNNDDDDDDDDDEENENKEWMRFADIDKNGELEIIDATFIQRHLAEIDIPYTIG